MKTKVGLPVPLGRKFIISEHISHLLNNSKRIRHAMRLVWDSMS